MRLTNALLAMVSVASVTAHGGGAEESSSLPLLGVALAVIGVATVAYIIYRRKRP